MEPRRKILPIFVPHVGCPRDCVFCNQRKISGAQNPATSETIAKTLENSPVAPVEVAFYGGSFTAIPFEEQKRLLEAVLPFLLSGRVTRVRVSTRPDCVDQTALERIQGFGVETVELGAQSMDDTVLLQSGRGHTSRDTEKAAALIKAAGLKLILQMMTGLPGDTREKSLETARRIAAMEPDGVRIYPTVVVKDTALYDMWRLGKYEEHTLEDALSWGAEIVEGFQDKKIPIIRLGLNPTDDLSGGAAIAGAYHPALGELIYARVYLNKARRLLSGRAGKNIILGVAPGRISMMTGQRKGNIDALKREFRLDSLKIREISVEDGEIVILDIAK